ncbi:MAG: dihydroneopterin aldolase [Candidatus Baltobacteraceae bacterium]
MDVIELRGMRVYGKHGANPGERDREQIFELNVRLELDLAQAASGDELQATLDYAALHARIKATVESTSFRLLERLASEVMGAIFADARVARAGVRIAKPQLLEGATPSVLLQRENPRYRAAFP